jgi:hypothetical protein
VRPKTFFGNGGPMRFLPFKLEMDGYYANGVLSWLAAFSINNGQLWTWAH